MKGYTRAGAFPYTLLLLGSDSQKRGARIFEVKSIGQKMAHTLNPIPRDLSDDKRLSLPSMKVREVAWRKKVTIAPNFNILITPPQEHFFYTSKFHILLNLHPLLLYHMRS